MRNPGETLKNSIRIPGESESTSFNKINNEIKKNSDSIHVNFRRFKKGI